MSDKVQHYKGFRICYDTHGDDSWGYSIFCSCGFDYGTDGSRTSFSEAEDDAVWFIDYAVETNKCENGH